MSPEEATKVIRANWPPENYTMLRSALADVLSTIDSQAAQIRALKVALIESNAELIAQPYGGMEDLAEHNGHDWWAVDGLKRYMPEVDGMSENCGLCGSETDSLVQYIVAGGPVDRIAEICQECVDRMQWKKE